MPNRDENLVFPNLLELKGRLDRRNFFVEWARVSSIVGLSGRFLSVTKIRQARRFIDGSVIDTVGAGGFLKLIEAEPVLYRLSVQGGSAMELLFPQCSARGPLTR